MIEITDADLLLRLTNFEDHFVERKTSGDSKDLLKTVVGFANSAPIGYPAVLYIGVRDNGEIEESVNLDSMQKTLGKKLDDAYPPVYYMTKVLLKDGKQFLAIIVPGSESRPHFAGPSYVRVGSETKIASEAQFQNLISQRQSKAYEILKWKGQVVSAYSLTNLGEYCHGWAAYNPPPTILDCTPHFLTISQPISQSSPLHLSSHPLERVTISYDNENHRLKLEIKEL